MKELTGRHVLITMLAFFGVTIGVNIALSYYALATFSGEDVARPYQRGLEYNRTLASRAEQKGLGWTASIAIEQTSGNNSTLIVCVRNANAKLLTSLSLHALLRRPTDARLDRSTNLRLNAEGEYEASLLGLASGAWDVVVSTRSQNGTAFVAERRVVIK